MPMFDRYGMAVVEERSRSRRSEDLARVARWEYGAGTEGSYLLAEPSEKGGRPAGAKGRRAIRAVGARLRVVLHRALSRKTGSPD